MRFSRQSLLFLLALGCALVGSQSARADELDALIQQAEKGNSTRRSPEDLAREQIVQITTGPTDRRRAAIFEARIFGNNPAIVKELIATLKKEPNLASMAALALGHMQRPEANAALVAALASPHRYVRESAAYALGISGEASAVPALEKARPEQPGLSRWIFDDAINTLQKGPLLPTVRRSSAQGAGVFFLGSTHSLDHLKDEWKPLIDKLSLRLFAIEATGINPQMGHYGGPLNFGGFTAMLNDKDGAPQIDVALVCNMSPDEFPFELQWQLFNFVRRGGSVVMLGETFYSGGHINTPAGKVFRTWDYVPDLFSTILPPKPDKEFRPFRAGMREPAALTTGVREFGFGRVMRLDGTAQQTMGARGFDRTFLDPEQYENILRYAIEGESGFPALIDLRSVSGAIESGKPVQFTVGLFSSLPKDAPAGELILELLSDNKSVATKSSQVDFSTGKLVSMTAMLPTDWRMPSGDSNYVARLTFKRGNASRVVQSPIKVQSPLALGWNLPTTIEIAGGELRGSATFESRLSTPIENATALFELSDSRGRVLQRLTRNATIKPGKNDAWPIALQARDYRADSYIATLSLQVDGKTVERKSGLIFRTKPFNFEQDLIVGSFGGIAPGKDERGTALMIASGFNASPARFGNPTPGWYNWSYDVAPKAKASAVWPGDLAEGMKGAEWGLGMRTTEPGWNVISHWDEGATKVLENDAGVEFPGADVFYRNWLKQKYRSLEKLNAAWASHMSGPKAKNAKGEAPAPWENDLTSWQQVQTRAGSPSDWHEVDANLWWMTLDAERREFRRTNNGHQFWHWSEVPHTRSYTVETPGTISWQQHGERAAMGNFPSSIMLHMGHPQKAQELMRRFPWGSYVSGARHLSVWCVSLGQHGPFGFNPGWTIWNADYTPKDWWKPSAASIERARSRDQVMLDAWSSMSSQVAVLYHGGNSLPRAFFDAIYFGGILPETLNPSFLRCERMDLSQFKVIYRVGKAELPPVWRDKIDAWTKAGGVLLEPMPIKAEYGPKSVDAEPGVKYWVGSDGTRLTSAQFAGYQAEVLAELAKYGVKPTIEVLDDAGLPAPVVEPALLETHDRSQFYLMAVPDSDIMGTQALGTLADEKFGEKIEIQGDFSVGVKFSTAAAGAKTYRVWIQAKSDKPFETRYTIDDKPPAAFRGSEKIEWARTERGLGKVQWIAGPAFVLPAGEHVIKLAHRGDEKPVQRALIVDEPMIEPVLRANTPVKSVYDVYNDRMLDRTADGLFRAPMRQSDGYLYSLVTEDLAPLTAEARLIESPVDRMLQVRIESKQKNGNFSACRHSLFVDVLDESGKAIAGLSGKTSVRGWRVLTLFPAQNDPPLPWKIRVKDLTTGMSAQALVTGASAGGAGEARLPRWDLTEALPALELKTEGEPMLLEGQIHLLPMQVTLVNNSDAAVEGKMKLEMPAELLLEGEIEKPVRVEAGRSLVVTWPVVLGREKALGRGMTESPPRCWLTLSDGRRFEKALETIWIRGWEKQPPRVTNLASSRIDVKVLNFLDKAYSLEISPKPSINWETKLASTRVDVPAGSVEKASVSTLSMEARVKAEAPQSPEIFALPLSVAVGGKTIDAGRMLVETEKERTWFAGMRRGMEQGDTFKISAIAGRDFVHAKKDHLWGLEWSSFRSDTLIDFPAEFAKATIGVTNVKFVVAGKVSARVRGQEDVEVWLAGRALEVGDGKAKGAEADGTNLSRDKFIDVPADKWMPLVVRYRKQTARPLTDLVFLDESGKVIWSVIFRAEVE